MWLPQGRPAPARAAPVQQLPCHAAPCQGQPRRRRTQPFALWLVQKGGKGEAAGRGVPARGGDKPGCGGRTPPALLLNRGELSPWG